MAVKLRSRRNNEGFEKIQNRKPIFYKHSDKVPD